MTKETGAGYAVISKVEEFEVRSALASPYRRIAFWLAPRPQGATDLFAGDISHPFTGIPTSDTARRCWLDCLMKIPGIPVAGPQTGNFFPSVKSLSRLGEESITLSVSGTTKVAGLALRDSWLS